jgi:hypothetical protein
MFTDVLDGCTWAKKTLKMVAVHSTKMLVNIYRTIHILTCQEILFSPKLIIPQRMKLISHISIQNYPVLLLAEGYQFRTIQLCCSLKDIN